MNICTRVGRRVRNLRREACLTQEQLASRAEIARESLSKIETGKREMGLMILGRIAKALDVSLEKFFEGM